MDTTKIIKLFVILQILLGVIGFVIWFPVQSHLPLSLQEYLNHDMEAEIDIVDLLAFTTLLIYMISVVGLLLTKMWARNLYAFGQKERSVTAAAGRMSASCRLIPLMALTQDGHPATARRAGGLISGSPAKAKRP